VDKTGGLMSGKKFNKTERRIFTALLNGGTLVHHNMCSSHWSIRLLNAEEHFEYSKNINSNAICRFYGIGEFVKLLIKKYEGGLTNSFTINPNCIDEVKKML
jgi:hypothetical protein